MKVYESHLTSHASQPPSRPELPETIAGSTNQPDRAGLGWVGLGWLGPGRARRQFQ